LSQQRRQYVRVKDVVRLTYEVIPESSLIEARQRMNFLRNQDADRYPFRPRPVGQLIDSDSSPAYRSLAEGIAKLDQKLDYLIFLVDKLGDSAVGQSSGDTIRCNISGSGMMFASNDKFSVGTYLRLSILLGSYNVTKPIHVIAKVLRVTGQDAEYGPQPYRVSMHFEDIADEDRETIIQHIFEVQRAEIRSRQEADDATAKAGE